MPRLSAMPRSALVALAIAVAAFVGWRVIVAGREAMDERSIPADAWLAARTSPRGIRKRRCAVASPKIRATRSRCCCSRSSSSGRESARKPGGDEDGGPACAR
jgi:hypothetical protein